MLQREAAKYRLPLFRDSMKDAVRYRDLTFMPQHGKGNTDATMFRGVRKQVYP